MKIILIGPVYPYKGGIAHYTCLLYRELVKSHDVELLSFKMMYPKLLFRKEQKDYSADTFKVDEAKFEINTSNPINIWQVGRKIKKKRPDMVLFQWWHPYFAPCYKILELALGKDIKIVFTCHNVFPHERFPFDRFLTKLVLKRGDGFIVHSKKDEIDLKSVKNTPNLKYNPHPTYNAFKIRDISQKQARIEIEKKDGFEISEDTQLLLFFGFVREYKGLKYLLQAMPMICEALPQCKLLVVGAFGDDKADYLSIIDELEIGDCVYLKDDYTPDDEVEKYFAATDLVTLPYIDATQSGIVQIAYGFEKPVVVTNVGGLPDVVKDGETGYVILPKDTKALADAILKFFVENLGREFSENIHTDLYKFSWEKMEETICSLQICDVMLR